MKTLAFKQIREYIITFKLPLLVLLTIIISVILNLGLHFPQLANLILLAIVILGSFNLFKTNIVALFHGKYALDYIALLAILVGVFSGQYLVAAVIVLMLSGGETLEEYGTNQAKQSLSALIDRIPNNVTLWENNTVGQTIRIDQVKIGHKIMIRKGEVVPLDGTLISKAGLIDESSLTGEPYIADKLQGDIVRSGTINAGETLVINVTKVEKDSTYRKIIDMVQAAQLEKAPLIRLADKYSTIFTIITLVISAAAYLLSHDFTRVLAVLVIATPCPLILATPIALMGGMNASAKRRIIMKKLSSIEVLSRIDTIIFDKTGTITLGKPLVKNVTILDPAYSEEQVYTIADAIERNSLHPLAKAITKIVKNKHYPTKHAKNVTEIIGSGITGEVDGKIFEIAKVPDVTEMAVQLTHMQKQIAVFVFEDTLKENSKAIIKHLKKLGVALYIYSGDKQEAVERILQQLGENVNVKAECTPEDKMNEIKLLKKEGKTTAMIGDGINDAPALAIADVGIVFSNEEQTAASEAADVILLGGDLSLVIQALQISKLTIKIALQSIIFGIGLSILGMLFAAMGIIVPIIGAFIQEGIDILVILNALRASKY